MAAKSATKASKVLEKAEQEKGEKLTVSETIKVAAPIYIPTILIGVGTITCFWGANIFNKRMQASLVSAYALIDNSYKEYKGKLKELYGEETHNNVVDAIVKEKCKDVYINSECLGASCNLETDSDNPVQLFYDECSNRYFETTLDKVIAAEYHLNRNFVLRGYAVINELYDFLGLEPTDYGSELGWAVDDEIYWIDFNHRKIVLDDGLECYIVETIWPPSLEWRELYS